MAIKNNDQFLTSYGVDFFIHGFLFSVLAVIVNAMQIYTIASIFLGLNIYSWNQNIISEKHFGDHL